MWEKVTTIVSFTESLVKVLRIMDGEKTAMGYIYEGIDRAKEATRLSTREIHQNISLYGKLLILGGTSSYIHHCM